MPAKKKSTAKAKPASTDAIHAELRKALNDARSKLKSAKGKNVKSKLQLLDHCCGIIDDIWFC